MVSTSTELQSIYCHYCDAHFPPDEVGNAKQMLVKYLAPNMTVISETRFCCPTCGQVLNFDPQKYTVIATSFL
jgi:hypothetical protein